MSKIKNQIAEELAYSPFVPVPEKQSEISEERAVRYHRIEIKARQLSGKILTIIDASISDEKQNKAIKDLVKKEFFEYIMEYQNLCYQGKRGHSIKLNS